MRTAKSNAASRHPTVIAILLAAALVFSAVVVSIQSSLFTGTRISVADGQIQILSDFQSTVQQCVASRGLGLTAEIIDHCKLVLKFPQGTNSTWVKIFNYLFKLYLTSIRIFFKDKSEFVFSTLQYNAQFKIFEPLEYKYDVCEAILLWEQYHNMTTVLTREYLDVRPDGWFDYAAKRIAQLGADKCYNRSLCEEHLNLILPAKPPFYPRQFRTCAVVGNSGDLLKTELGQEIDEHDAVFRDNEAPVNEKYAKYVGLKRDFRLVVRGVARNMAAIMNGSSDEVLIIKSVMHRDFNAMIKDALLLDP